MTADLEIGAPAIVEFAHQGAGYFGVMLYDARSGQLVAVLANELDPGTVAATFAAGDGGAFLAQVEAPGAWSVQVSQ